MSEEVRSEATPEADAAAPRQDAAPAPRRKRWGCLRTAVLLAVVFGSGLVCGVGLTLHAARQYLTQPERRAERATRWLDRHLDLTDEQAAQVGEIMRRQVADLAALREEMRPRVIERLEQTNTEIEAVLTPPQRDEWREFVERFRERWLGERPE